MKLTVIMEKSTTGYSAFSKELPGLVTIGDSIKEVKENFRNVIELQADYLKDNNQEEKSKNLLNSNLVYYLDLETFFDYYSMFNKSKLADYLDINQSLLRKMLKNKNIELSDKKAEQIETGLHRLADELKEIHFV